MNQLIGWGPKRLHSATYLFLNWSRREDLNAPSAEYDSAALLLSYTGPHFYKKDSILFNQMSNSVFTEFDYLAASHHLIISSLSRASFSASPLSFSMRIAYHLLRRFFMATTILSGNSPLSPW